MSTRHFLSLRDLTPEELGNTIQRAIELKAMQKRGELHEPLRNKMLALVFDKSSTYFLELDRHLKFLHQQELHLTS